ncbi:pentatricopeptide repeat-containing protein At1g62914, mitochondrial-like [Camellia sinensis]|uniref:pentatricopeptide repeat-containing protein At1g62914, mitochondrial-like n=1 Tax=Camellia sinensis TaxID=4442 RepID=UPI001036BD13|nr:pentatricopeptide repeat-containing protein At1g62914, mitochondrial-like [Camellia sinensis]
MTMEEEKQRIPIAQGLPLTTDEPECLVKPAVKEITRPVDLVLHSDVRAVKRAEFDQQLAEKMSLIEQYREKRERQQKLAEEEEIRRLRKELIPKAQLMPYFDRTFIPRRLMKHCTIPREPKFHIPPQHKKIICGMCWDDIYVLVIAAFGAVKHEDIVVQVKKLFTKLSTDPTTTSEFFAKEPAIFTGSEDDDDIPLAKFAVAFNGASWTDPDSIALIVMQSMLGSWNKNAGGGKHMGSELAQRVGINEIAENMMAFNTNYKDTGLFGVYAIAKENEFVSSWVRQADKFTLNIVINCFCKLNRVDLGFSILGNLLKLGYEPNITTFNTLINGLCVNAKIALAVKFLDEIVEKGFQPNFITYNTIINGLCKIGNTSVAIRLLRKIEEIGGCEPGLVEYSTVIDSLCKDRLVTKAFKLFSEMIGKAISPNVVTYTSLIQGVSSLGEWEETTRLLNEMVGKNIWPNVRTFSILVDALCKEGKAKEAQDVVELMIQRGVVPDVVTYNAVMDGYCLCGQVDEARKMLDVIVSRGCAPSLFTYNILINGYCKIKSIDEAMSLFKEMSRKRLLPDTITHTTLIGGLARRLRDALLLFNEMQVQGQIPNLFTYSVLLDGLCKNQHLDEVLALFEKLEHAGLAPDIVIYSNLIEGMCLGGKLDDARKAT